MAFLGPSAYVSPDHYASQPHFSTWAYAAVHVMGRPRLLDEVRTMRQLDDLIEDQESRLAPKQPWSLPRRASALFDEYLRLIQGFEIPIGRIDGVYKLGQNKSPADMASQARAFRERGGQHGAARRLHRAPQRPARAGARPRFRSARGGGGLTRRRTGVRRRRRLFGGGAFAVLHFSCRFLCCFSGHFCGATPARPWHSRA